MPSKIQRPPCRTADSPARTPDAQRRRIATFAISSAEWASTTARLLLCWALMLLAAVTLKTAGKPQAPASFHVCTSNQPVFISFSLTTASCCRYLVDAWPFLALIPLVLVHFACRFWGPWTNAESTFSNEYFRLLVEEKWTVKKTHQGKPWAGPLQYEAQGGSLMMLPADLWLLEDKDFRKHVETYAKDEDTFFKDFAAAFSKLLELGVKF